METSPSSPVLICSPQGRPGTGYSYHAEVLRGQSGCGAAALPAPVSSLGGDGPGDPWPPRPSSCHSHHTLYSYTSDVAGTVPGAENSEQTRSLLLQSGVEVNKPVRNRKDHFG